VPYTPTPLLHVQTEGMIATLTMNNPEARNPAVPELHEALADIWTDLGRDDDVNVVIVTGAGKAFSAGGDMDNFIRDHESPVHRRAGLMRARRILDEMAAFPKPVIAAVNGPAVGFGCNLALSCDLVLVAQGAFLADNHVEVGLVCGDGGAIIWPLLMSLIKAKEFLFTGERIPADRAVELGLATRVVPDAELMTEARALAEKLAALPNQPLQDTKRALNLHFQAAINMVAPFALAAESESFAGDAVRVTVENFKRRQAAKKAEKGTTDGG
jgi:enoyl-CoA hydratase